MISLVRVDNRLIHGQVVEAWFPKLRTERVVVADDEAAENVLTRTAMGLAVPAFIEVRIEALRKINYAALTADVVKTLLVIRDIAGVFTAREHGLKFNHLNLGNIHFSTHRRKITSSVFLSGEELNQLRLLAEEGIEVEARGIPTDSLVTFPEITERFGKVGLA